MIDYIYSIQCRLHHVILRRYIFREIIGGHSLAMYTLELFGYAVHTVVAPSLDIIIVFNHQDKTFQEVKLVYNFTRQVFTHECTKPI